MTTVPTPQPLFPVVDLDPEVLFLLGSLARTVKTTHAVIRNLPCPHSHLGRDVYPILYALRGGKHRVGDIADHAMIDISTASRHISSLVEHGLAAKMPDPNDRRAQLISLTEQGLQVVADITTNRGSWLAEALASWSAEDISHTAECLQKLTAAMTEHYATLTSQETSAS